MCDECALRFYVCSIFVDRVFVPFIFHHGVHWTFKCFAYVAPRGWIWVRRGLCGFGDIRGSVGRYDPWGIKATGFAVTTKINHYAAVTSLPMVFARGGTDACTPRQGVTLLYGPSICTRSVQMDLLRSQVLQPFPTPGSGTLWLAGESLRDRRVSCLPRWTVCPTRSPSLGPNRSTCRGECFWSGPLVNPPGRCHRGPLTNGPGRIPPYCVCSGGADTVTGGAPKPLRLGPSPASPVGPFRSAPHFAVWFAVVGFPSLRGGVVVVGGGGVSLFLAVLLVCVSPPPLVVVRRRCVCLWRGACARGVCVGV